MIKLNNKPLRSKINFKWSSANQYDYSIMYFEIDGISHVFFARKYKINKTKTDIICYQIS